MYRFTQSGIYEHIDFAFTGTTSNGRFTAQFKLPEAIGLQARYYYNRPNATMQSRIRAMHRVDFGLNKKLFNDRLALTADVTNAFDTRRYRSVVTVPNYTISSMSRFNGARYRLSLSYKIGREGQSRQAKASNRN
ncbi:outer membrane beta-barrel protein [Olivibacter ginsenosidimutans]